MIIILSAAPDLKINSINDINHNIIIIIKIM